MKLINSNSKNVVILILTILIVAGFFWIRKLTKDQKFSEDLIEELKMVSEEKVEIPETKILRDMDFNANIAKTKIIPKYLPQNSLPKNIVRYYEDTVKLAIMKLADNKKNQEILNYTKIIGKLKGELDSKNSMITQLQDSTMVWSNHNITIKSNFKNKTSSYDYDADLDFVITKEKGDQYLYAISKDSSFKIQNTYNYKKKIIPIKNKIKLSWDNSINYGFGPTSSRINTNWRPFYVTSGLKLIYNPDGILRPYLGGYYWLDINSYQSFYMGTVGLDIKLLSR